MLSSVPELKKTCDVSREKKRMSEKFKSDMSYSAIGHKFNVNESMIFMKYGVCKKKHM